LTEDQPSNSPITQKAGTEAKTDEGDLPAEIETKELDAEFQQVMKSAPPKMRHMMLSMMMRLQGAGPMPHPIFDKFKSEHVDKFLDYSHEDEVNAFSLARSNRWFHLGYALLFVGVLLFLIVYLAPTQKDLLGDILKMLAIFAGGFGAGFGTKSFFGKKD